MRENRAKGARSGRLWAFGTTGVAAAITLLMVLAPASAGAVHPLKVLTAPYKHTVSQVNNYVSVTGCAKSKSSVPKWTPTTGAMSSSDAAQSK